MADTGPGPTGGLGATIRISRAAQLTFRVGEAVTLTVIKNLVGSKWAVGVRGHVLTAASRAPLVVGQQLRALVTRTGDRIVLRLNGRPLDPLAVALERAGLPADPLGRAVTQALMRSHLPVRAEMVSMLRGKIGEGVGRSPRARALAVALQKGIDPMSRGTALLLDLLVPDLYSPGDDGADERRRRRKPPTRETDDDSVTPRALRDSFERGGERHDALTAFNHLGGSGGTWVVLPFRFDTSAGELSGVVRAHLRPGGAGPDVDALAVTAGHSRAGRTTVLRAAVQPGGNGGTVRLDRSTVADPSGPDLAALARKLRSLGFDLDDTLDGDTFDGFSDEHVSGGYMAVDALG